MQASHRPAHRPARPEIVEHDDYLEVLLVPGPGTPRSKQARIDAVAALASERGKDRVLVVCEDPGSHLERDEAYWLGDTLGRRLAQVRTAIAITARPVDYLDDYSARVARERGAAVRYFDTITGARRWLLQTDPG